MRKALVLFLSLVCFALPGSAKGERTTIWQIGTKDRSARELALAPDQYKSYLSRDFGWEDGFYLVGKSAPETDFPYVLPGPGDGWNGSSGGAGTRSAFQNIFFDIQKKGKGSWYLVLDFVDTQYRIPPLLKVSVNGKAFKYELPKGEGDGSLLGDYSHAHPYTLEIPLSASDIREGHNEICLYSLEGSWAVFDDIRLEGPASTQLRQDFGDAYVRTVSPASYLTLDGGAQPLIVGADHLQGHPVLSVELDGKEILSKTLEGGYYEFEAPMPAVRRKTRSRYTVKVDGVPVRSGKVLRTPCQRVTPADYIDTRMGTAHSRWMLAPGPWMPFSMVKLSPDNQNRGWQGGYDSVLESVGTFSHIHEWTMAGLGTMPVTGPLKTEVGDQSEVQKGYETGYRSRIDKATEIGDVGYYAVRLTDYDILAELTATDRCSFQRYTYPSGEKGRVMIDLQIPAEYGYGIVGCQVVKAGPRTVKGYCRQETPRVWSHDADQFYTVWFTIEFDRDIERFAGWSDSGPWEGESCRMEGPKDFGCYVEFAPARKNVVQMRTGLSFVDADGADNNLRAEISEPFGWDFDAVRAYQRDTWNDILSRVQVRCDDRRELKRFYTNLYRSHCRNTFNDVDGRWVDQFEKVQTLPDPDMRALGCDAFWNTFWNLNQVWNLLTPEWSSRWVKSQLALYDATGWLGKGPAGMKLIPVMVAEHEIPQMIGAYQMGIRDYDVEKMFGAVVKMQTTPAAKVGRGFAGNRDLLPYLKYHYVPYDLGRYSNAMEYSYDDWTVSQLALALGKQKEYETFADRGTWWKNAINREDGYCHMKDSKGKWLPDFDPFKSGANAHYVEANAWQMTYFVPQDVEGLAEWIGKERFIERLDWGFRESYNVRFNAPNERYGDYPVVHGNQQSMQFAFLFNYVGAPWLTQKWSRAVMDRYYGYDFSNCWLGDEDQGQMSAWLVMASLGLFQTEGGCSATPHFEIGSPLFPEAVIDLGGRYGRGEKFVITAHDASRTNKYVQSARLNGQPLDTFLIDASEVLKGGELELWMGPEPNRAWGVAEGQ